MTIKDPVSGKCISFELVVRSERGTVYRDDSVIEARCDLQPRIDKWLDAMWQELERV